jgi:uncharacterized protein with GYD domain
MATYLVLINFTEQGVQKFRDTRKRAGAFRSMAEKAGVTVREQLWTLGRYDGAVVLDADDDAAVTGLMLSLASLGNVKTQTLRAFEEKEMDEILGRVPKAGGRK